MGYIGSEVWVPTPSNPTVTYEIAAGVTQRTAVQVVNNSVGEVWIGDFGAIPPASAAQAKYIVPPRATANLPLASSQFAARWNSLASGTSDVVTFTFTDDIVVPTIIPGVNSVGGIASAVQTFQATVADNGGSWPKTLTTNSGKNIGSIYVYNRSGITWRIQFSTGGFKRTFIAPYSWVCIPVNAISGSVDVGPLGSIITGFLQNDSVFIAFSDIDYVTPFPAGSGVLQSPLIDAGAGEVNNDPTTQIAIANGVGAAGTFTLYTIPQVAGTVYSRIAIQSFYLTVKANGTGAAAVNLQMNLGLDGLGAAIPIFNLGVDVGGSAVNQMTLPSPLIISNKSLVAGNLLQLVTFGGAAFVRADYGIHGWVLL